MRRPGSSPAAGVSAALAEAVRGPKTMTSNTRSDYSNDRIISQIRSRTKRSDPKRSNQLVGFFQWAATMVVFV